jgi:hypothetical protein
MATTTDATLPATCAETADMTVFGSLPIPRGEERALSGLTAARSFSRGADRTRSSPRRPPSAHRAV